MNINEFERQTKKVLSESRADVDLENLLIDLHLKKKDQKPLYVSLVLGLAALILFSGFAYKNWTQNQDASMATNGYIMLILLLSQMLFLEKRRSK